ncbi:MAG: BatA domain-containing protein [Zavarzinella sp.]
MILSLFFAVVFASPLSTLAVAGAAVAVPVLIHFLNRKRFIILPFAAMRFLLAAQKKNVRRMRLEKWLLLLLRSLLLLSLIFAMAAMSPWAERLWQVVYPGQLLPVSNQGRTHRLIVLENTFTMTTNREDGSSRLDYALAQALSYINNAPAGDGFTVIVLQNSLDLLIPGPADDRQQIVQAIESIQPQHTSGDHPGCLNQLADLCSRPLGKFDQREVVFFSDIRQSAWELPKSMDGASTTQNNVWDRILQNADVVFVDCAGKDEANISVVALQPAEPIVFLQQDVVFQVTIANHGRTAVNQLPVEFLLGPPGGTGPLRTIAQQLVEIPPRSTIQVTFPLVEQNRLREVGNYQVQVRVGEDSLRVDNSRSFILPVLDRIPVLVVNGKPANEPLERASGFLVAAINPNPELAPNANTPGVVQVLSPREFTDSVRGELFQPNSPINSVFLCDLPRIGATEIQRLEALLKRGGSVFIGMGPNVANNMDEYNRLLFADGQGILPGKLISIQENAETGYYFSPMEGAFDRPPLQQFRKEEERASIRTPRISKYIRMELPANSAATRILNYENADQKATNDPALVVFPLHRGKVYCCTSSLNRDWNDWPNSFCFLPMIQETLKDFAATSEQKVLATGDVLEEYVSRTFSGLTVEHFLDPQKELLETTTVELDTSSAVVRSNQFLLAGFHRFVISGQTPLIYAVNVPTLTAKGGTASDLQRFSLSDWQTSSSEPVQLVNSASSILARNRQTQELEPTYYERAPRGPDMAKLGLWCFLILLMLELVAAWKFGSARAGVGTDDNKIRTAFWHTFFLLLPLLLATTVLVFSLVFTAKGEFLSFAPTVRQKLLEDFFMLPTGAPGEGMHIRWETRNYLHPLRKTHFWLAAGLLVGCTTAIVLIYRAEKLAHLRGSRGAGLLPRSLMIISRSLALALALYLLLPQSQLVVEREAWPEIVVLIDDSKSMSVIDKYSDINTNEIASKLHQSWLEYAAPEIRALTDQRDQVRAKIAASGFQQQLTTQLSLIEQKIDWLSQPNRLNLVRGMLVANDGEFLPKLLSDKQLRIHLCYGATEPVTLATIDNEAACPDALKLLLSIDPMGESSRTGEMVTTLIRKFRGRSLSSIIVFSDGVITTGEKWSETQRTANRANIPLFFVGTGEENLPPDIAISEFRAEDVVNVNDRLIIDFRLICSGSPLPTTVPVVLYEKIDNQLVELQRQTISLAPGQAGKRVRFIHQPKEEGEKIYVVDTPTISGEGDTTNNNYEHPVLVLQARQIRLLMVDGYPRYDFRYLRSIFERELATQNGVKSVQVDFLQLSEAPDARKQSTNSISRFPTSEELSKYDVIYWGDVDPNDLPGRGNHLETVADWVKKGGGIIFQAGRFSNPARYRGTPLEEVLPVQFTDAAGRETATITKPYHLQIAVAGKSHPMFRMSADDDENMRIWQELQPLYWYDQSVRAKLSAEVLALHPEMMNTEPTHALIAQQFYGGGRVIFIGFDETWRWRFRNDESRFNQFWIQTIRMLARGRVGRTELRTDQKTYRRDEPMRITVRFPDDAPVPTEVVEVALSRRALTDRNRVLDQQTLKLAKQDGSRSTYEVLYTGTLEGDYALSTIDPKNNRLIRTTVQVLPPPGEMENTQLDRLAMNQAALTTRGGYFPVAGSGELIDSLPEGVRIPLDQPCPPYPIWNHPWVFVLLLTLFSAEWIYRKKWRLL